jgi:hypothetical protein
MVGSETGMRWAEYGRGRTAATTPGFAIFSRDIGDRTVHGLKPIFLALSLVLVALGLAYVGLGGRALLQGEARAGVLLGLGAAAAVVGMVLWALVRRMGDGG